VIDHASQPAQIERIRSDRDYSSGMIHFTSHVYGIHVAVAQSTSMGDRVNGRETELENSGGNPNLIARIAL
jgi:hypothetical protein